MAGIHTGKQLTVVEAQDASYVPFNPGQLIIEDKGAAFYDRTSGTSVESGRSAISSGASSNNAPFNMKGVIHSTSTMPTAPAEGDTYIFTDTQSLNGDSTLSWLNKNWTSFPTNMSDFDKCEIVDAPDDVSTNAYTSYDKALRIENYKGDPQGLTALAAAEKLIITLGDTEVPAMAVALPAERVENEAPVTYILLAPVRTTDGLSTITNGTVNVAITLTKQFEGSSDGVALSTRIYNGDLVRYTGKYWQIIGRGGSIKFSNNKALTLSSNDTTYDVLQNPYNFGASSIALGGGVTDYWVPDNVISISGSSSTSVSVLWNVYGHDKLRISGGDGKLAVVMLATAYSLTNVSDNWYADSDAYLTASNVGHISYCGGRIHADTCESVTNCTVSSLGNVTQVSGCELFGASIASSMVWDRIPSTSLYVTKVINSGDVANGINGLSKYVDPNCPKVNGTPPNLTYTGIGSQYKVLQTASKWESTTTYTDYPYRTYIDVPYMTEEHFPYVIFDPTALASGVFDGAPVETAQNKLYIYAKSIPTFDFQIDFKAVV